MASEFTRKAQNTLQASLNIACEMGHSYIGSEHLLVALTEENGSTAARLLEARGAKREKIRDAVLAVCGTGSPSALCASDMTPRLRKIIESSAQEAGKSGQTEIGTEHLLAALCAERECVAVRILDSAGISAPELYGDVTSFLSALSTFHTPPAKGSGGTGTQQSPSGPPTVMTYGTDLCAAAKAGKLDPVIGRDTETERMIRILSRRQKNNPCLIGEPGVGKTAIAEGLAIRIANGNVPDSLLEKRIVTLDIAGMVAGAKYRGEFEERFKNVIKEATADPDLILFIDEIHNLIGAGAAEGAVDAANIIKPALARSDIRVIGATTVTEYRKYIEKDAALERRFQSIPVGEPSEEDAIRILQGLRPKYEAHHHLHIPDETIRAAVHLSVRYLPDRFLPDKAIDLIDEAASRIRICADSLPPDLQQTQDELAALRREKEAAINAQNFAAAASLHEKETELLAKEAERRTAYTRERDENPLQVRPEDIFLVISQWTGIPVTKPEEDTAKKLLGLEAALQKRIIGQDRAIDAVCRAVRRGRTGLKNPHRPVASFLFLGSTGVGKTELSRALASVLFGNENAMIRFDMSEYMERHSVSKLIGSPPGYVGYEEGGQLTEKIRRHPYSVLLFDEIEKAHPDVFNLLLQVLEDGRLTDSQGRTVSFADAVVIMTSNLGSSDLNPQQAVGFTENRSSSDEPRKKEIMQAVRAAFRPEFLNRIDEIILFSPLGEAELKKIADLHLNEIAARSAELGITLHFSDQVRTKIAMEGADSLYGARPLRRACIRLIEDPLSTAMLEGTVKPGDTVRVDTEEDRIVLKKEP